jgi:hypothetical protein
MMRSILQSILAVAVTFVACASPLDVVIVFDRTEATRPHGTDDLVSALQTGRRLAIASIVPEFRVHTPLTDDAGAIERGVEAAVATQSPHMTRRPRLYEVATKTADLFDTNTPTKRGVLVITFNREKPSDKRTREVLDLYRMHSIRLDVIVLPSGTGRRPGVHGGATGPPGGVFCDPGPGCPPLGNGAQPDLGTLDRIAVGTGGRVWRIRANERIDWDRLVAEMDGRAITSNGRP